MELHSTNLVPDQLIKALCNTLIHSLWQGLILAAIAGLVIIATKKSGAALRYNLMIGLLIVFSAAATVTFFMQLEKAGSTNVTPLTVMATSPVSQTAAVNVQPTEKPASLFANCVNYFNMHSDTVVLIWFLIICARCIQLGAGLHHIYYIRRTKVFSPGTLWEDRVNELAGTLGIKRAVALLQSGVVKLPMVLGHFKPVILIPIGLLTALSTEGVESILVHELAHIRRRDYLVNILQNLIEIVFFFNPAVLWVSALIKAERENCCDDIVVAQTTSKVSYIKALVSCQEYQSAMPAYAMGLGGHNDHFLQRVKRMLSNNNQTLNKVEKMVLTICLIGAVLTTAAFSKASKSISAKPKFETPKVPVTGKDTGRSEAAKVYKTNEVGDGTMMQLSRSVNHKAYKIYLFKKDGTLYQYTAPDNHDGKYYVNSEQLPDDRINEYKQKFDQLLNEYSDSAPTAPTAPAKPFELQLNGGKGEMVDNADNKVAAIADTTKKGKGKTGTVNIDSDKTVYYYNNSKKSTYKANSKAHKNYSNKSTYYYSSDSIPAIPAVPAIRPIPAIPAVPAVPAIAGVPAIPAIPTIPPANSKIADELIKEHLVKDSKNFTFRITDDELYIDGIKQSDELHQRIIKQFVKPGSSINMTYTVHGDSKTINRD